MIRALGWLGLSLWCLACGETEHGSPGSAGQAGEVSASGASAGGHPNASGAGGTASKANAGNGGSSNGGVPSSGSAGTHAGVGGTPEAEGGEAPHGEGGGPSEPCNELELVATPATCTTFNAPPAAQGGTIVPGLYVLQSYQMPICFAGLQQTLRIVETATGVFSVETVANIGDTHANGSFVRSATTISSTSTCGGDEQDKLYSYDAYQQQQVDYLRLWDVDSVFVYQRIGD